MTSTSEWQDNEAKGVFTTPYDEAKDEEGKNKPARQIYSKLRQHNCANVGSNWEQKDDEAASIFSRSLGNVKKIKSPYSNPERDNIHFKVVDDEWLWNRVKNKGLDKTCIGPQNMCKTCKLEGYDWTMPLEVHNTMLMFCP